MHAASRAAGLVLGVSSLMGCARYQAAPLNPSQELASLRTRDVRVVLASTTRPNADEPVRARPFDAADGLDEREVVAVALSLNPEIAVRRAEIGESQALLITAGAWPNPVLGLSVQPGVSGESGALVSGDLLFQLLRIGERDARKKSAAAAVGQARADAMTAEYRLVGEVRSQRLLVLAGERKVALLREAVALRQQAVDNVRRQNELGEASALTRSAIDLELAQASRELRQAGTDFGQAQRTLNRLLGLPPDYALRLTELGQPLRVAVFDDLDDDELDRRLLAGRPEIRAAEAAYEKAEQELRLAVLQQYPALGIGPAFERDIDGGTSIGLGLSLELPILNQNQGPIAEKRAARERAHAQYTAALHQLRADAFEARSLVRAAKAEIDAQERDVLPLLQRTQDLFESAYRAREINIIDWIVAQQRALTARQEYLDTIVKYRQAIIQLETATGQPLPAEPAVQPTTRPDRPTTEPLP